MLLDIKKLFTKGTTIGRVEYWRTVYGLLLFPMLLVYAAIIIPPNNAWFYPVALITLIVAIPYIIIYWIATYRRFNNIFDKPIVSIIILIIFFFSIEFKLLRLAFIAILLFIPGKLKSENKVSSKLFWSTFPLVIILAISARYIGFNRYIASGSMENALQKNDRIIINIFDKDYKRGDIIAHQANKSVYVKRIIALPGEKIEIKELKDGSYGIYINDQKLSEPYVKDNYDYLKLSSMPYRKMIVPDNSYYVMGDNRGNSLDSRYYGAVHKDLIKGKVSHIWYPINRRQVFNLPQYTLQDTKKKVSKQDIQINDVNTYMNYMQNTMKENWNPPKFDSDLTATVLFTIEKDGTITNARIKTSSGNREMDNIAVLTVKNVYKLPPLPTEITKQHNKIDVSFTFTHKFKQTK